MFLTSLVLALKEALGILSISFLTSFILELRVVLVAKSVIPGILSSIFLVLALYASFLTTSFFNTSIRGCLYGSRYISQIIYWVIDVTFLMHLYERTKLITCFD